LKNHLHLILRISHGHEKIQKILQIIKEYHEFKGKEISEKEILFLQKRYRQREPDQFLSMYDAMRDRADTEKKN